MGVVKGDLEGEKSSHFCIEATLYVIFIAVIAFILFNNVLRPRKFGYSLPYSPDEHPSTSNRVLLSHGYTHYVLTGSSCSDIVVLIHGYSLYSYQWETYQKMFKRKGYCVLSYDLYGRGYSTAPETTYDEHLFVAQLVDLLYKLQITKKIILVGYSMGGAIATKFASIYPNKIKKLVLIAPAGFPINPPKDTFITYIPVIGELVMVYTRFAQERMLRNVGNKFIDPNKHARLVRLIHDRMKLNFEHNPSFSMALLQTLRDFPMGGLQHAFEEVGKHDYPVQVIWGDKDHLCPFENSKLLLQAIPRAELVTFEGLEHYFVFESENEIIDTMLQFFAKP